MIVWPGAIPSPPHPAPPVPWARRQSIATGRPVRLEMRQRTQRPTLRQEIRSPPVPQEPKLVDVKPASQ